jgi:hypothetical protein
MFFNPSIPSNIDQIQGAQRFISEIFSENLEAHWDIPGYCPLIVPQRENLTKYIEMLDSETINIQLEGLMSLRKLISDEPTLLIERIIEADIVFKLFGFMSGHDDIRFQRESTWIIANICSGTNDDVEYVVNLGGLDIIMGLLKSDSEDVLDQAIWALGNISAEDIRYRDLCLNKKCVEQLVAVAAKFPRSQCIKKNIAWVMLNLVGGTSLPAWHHIYKGFPLLKQILSEKQLDSKILADVMWCLVWTSAGYIQEIIGMGFVQSLIDSLKHDQDSLLLPALKIFGSIIKADHIPIEKILGFSDFLPRIFELISHSELKVRKKACWLLKKITSKSNFQISLILDDSNYMEALRETLTQDAEEVAFEVAKTLGNLVSQAPSKMILRMINEYKYLELLSFMLNMTDIKIQERALQDVSKVIDTIDETPYQRIYINMLRKEGLNEIIHTLVSSNNRRLSRLAKSLRGQIKKVCQIEKKEKKEEEYKRDERMWMEERKKALAN